MVSSKPLKSMPKPALEDLKQLLRDNLADLRREYRVSSLWLFGSCVRGEQHKRSDLDILVEFEEVPTLLNMIENLAFVKTFQSDTQAVVTSLHVAFGK